MLPDTLKLLIAFGNNLALLIVLTYLYGQLTQRLRHLDETLQQIVQGTLFAAIAIMGMQIPVQISEGIIVDGRIILVLLAGPFVGRSGILVTGILIILYRIYLGGIGTLAGTGAIASAMLIGWLFAIRFSARQNRFTPIHGLILAAIATPISLLWVFALPENIPAWPIFSRLIIPVGIMYPATALILGSLLLHEHNRQNLVRAVRQSEQKYRTLVEGTPDILYRTNQQGRIDFVSPSVKEIAGYTPEEARELLMAEDIYLVPEQRQIFLQQLKEKGEVRGFEAPLKRKDGSIWWASTNAHCLYNKHNEIIGVEGVARDITRKKMDRQLKIGQLKVLEKIAHRNVPLQHILTAIAELAEQQKNGMRVSILQLEEGRLIDAASPSLPPDFTDALQATAFAAHSPSFVSSAFYRMRKICDNIGSDPHWQELHALAAYNNLACCWSEPLINSSGEALGVFSLFGDTPAQPEQDDIELLLGMANLASIAIEQHQTETELRDTVSLLHLVLDTTPLYIYWKDIDCIYRGCNRTFAKAAGFDDPQKLIGKTDFDLPWSENEAKLYVEGDLQVIQSEQPLQNLQQTQRKADGCVIDIESSKFPMRDPQGNVMGVLGVYQDISQRKKNEESRQQSEAKFRTMFESSVVGMIVVINSNGLITEWNRGAQRAFGYEAEEIIGKPLTKLMPAKYREAHEAGFQKAVQQGKLHLPGVTHQLSGLRKNGEEFPLELTLGCWEQKGKLYFSAIILDITERKTTEEALRRTQKMDAIGKMAGGVAHDFNNILGIIIGNLNLLSKQLPEDEKISKRLDTIRKSTKRATDLTKQLLGFSRNQSTQAETININEHISQMNALMERSITPQIEVKQNLSDDLWPVCVDPGDFGDALLNLVINARDAMPDGGRLTIATQNITIDRNTLTKVPGADPGQYVELALEDTGQGISRKDQEHIFEPFFTSKPEGKGTGLGLAMVFSFTQRCQGYVTVTSTPGEGSRFCIYLPRATGSVPVSVSTPAHQELPRGSELILVVDDEAELRSLAKEMLEDLGYQVLAVADAQAALNILESNSIDLLFSDVVMPGGMDGFKLAEKASQDYPGLKILLTSGYTKQANPSEELKFSVQLLRKPYSHEQLAIAVRKQLGTIAPTQQNHLVEQPMIKSISWQPEYNIGIPQIDQDHQELVNLLNRCRSVAASKQETQELMAILVELKEYVGSHFEREEEYLQQQGYPGLQNHQQVHRVLERQVEQKFKQLEQNELDIEALLQFIEGWLFDHILGMDLKAFAQQKRSDETNTKPGSSLS